MGDYPRYPRETPGAGDSLQPMVTCVGLAYPCALSGGKQGVG